MWPRARPVRNCLLGLGLVLSAGPAAAVNLRKAILHTPGLSLLQGHVDLAKTNSTALSAAANATATKTATNALVLQPVMTVMNTTVGAAQANVTASSMMHFKLGKEQTAVLTMVVTGVMAALALLLGFLAIALLLCALYDLVAQLIHKARFRSCRMKIQRAHAAFHSKTGELPLCPYCCESFSTKRGPSKVVFLCGHRLHVECSNKWFGENPDNSTHCPICRDVEPFLSHDCCGKTELQPASNCDHVGVGTVVDGAFAFILGSLHRLHPEIVTKACVDRWLHCNTEIWLSELKCPRYNPVLNSTLNMVMGKNKA